MNIQELINDEATTIVDVRTEGEFLGGNVSESINIPLDKVIEKMEDLRGMQPLVLCCASGNRSGQATAYLKSNGFINVYNGGGWEMVKAQKA
jgi:phage shock protein E